MNAPRRLVSPVAVRLESLEDRTVPATFDVTNLADSGDGSFRQAILELNNSNDPDNLILFAPELTGVIALASDLPTVSEPVEIRGPGRDRLTINGQNNVIFTIDDGFNGNSATVEISGLTLTNGQNTDGGAVLNEDENLILSNMAIRNNTATGRGGAVASNEISGQVTIISSILEDNVAQGGGGGAIAQLRGDLGVINSVIRNNVAEGTGDGGGILQVGTNTNTTLLNTLIENNQALGGIGGGYRAQEFSFLSVIGSSFVGNQAGKGGAMHVSFAKVTIQQSTLSGNTASDAGGAIRIINSGQVDLENSTLAENVANQNALTAGLGGGISIDPYSNGTASLRNSIVAGNLAGSTPSDIEAGIGRINPASSNNLIGVDTNLTGISNGKNNNLIGTDQAPIDPLLAPLNRNGGVTPTHALQAGSPAIDAGDIAAVAPDLQEIDQRGAPFVRVSGSALDIGAYELQDSKVFVVTTDEDTNNPVVDLDRFSLREALARVGSEAQTINFASDLAGETITLTLGQLDIQSAVTINGLGTQNLTISGDNLARLFDIDDRDNNVLVDVNISGLTLANGAADSGGAIRNQENLSLANVHITGSKATVDGGGIFAERGSVSLQDSTISDNQAGGNGGGIAVLTKASVSVSNSTVSGNTAGNSGGGIFQSSGSTTLRVTNSTIAFNTADADNTDGGAGGGLARTNGTTELESSIVARNQAGDSGMHPDVSGTVEVDFSLIENITGFDPVDSDNDNNVTGANPLLQPLGDNGGPTPTHALDKSSPAVNRGSNPDDLANDQRGLGFPRVDGAAADIGAFETDQPLQTIQVTVERPGQPDPTNQLPLSFVVTFSEPVTDLTEDDLIVTAEGNDPTVTLTGSNASYLVQIGGLTSAGEVTLDVPAGVVFNAMGNTNAASTSSDNSIFYDPNTSDLGPTVVIGQAEGQLDPTDQQPIRFTLTFSEPVTGLEASDIVIDNPAGNTPEVSLTGSEDTYFIEISNLIFPGELTVSLPAGVATDATGNLSAPAIPNSPGEDSVLFNASFDGPTVSLEIAPGQNDPTPFLPLRFAVEFSVPVTGFTAEDIVVTSEGNDNPEVRLLGTGASYTIEIENLSVPGPVTVFIPAQVAVDAAGNPNAASTSSDNTLVFDPTAPGFTPVGQNSTSIFAVGASFGGPNQVVVYDGSNEPGTDELYRIDVDLPGFSGGLRTAQADVTGDGEPDVIIGTGPGISNRVFVYDGMTRGIVAAFNPFETSFGGGLFVAAVDINGDSIAEIIVSPDQSGGPIIAIYNGGDFVELTRFFGIEDPNFRGGARVGVGDINRDGLGDLAVGAGFGGGPRMALFNGALVLAGDPNPKFVQDFFVFEQSLRDGAWVAVGDLDGDGFGDLYLGGGPQGGPRVRIFSGAILITGQFNSADPGTTPDVQLGNFFGDNPDSRSGIRVGAKDLNGDGLADIMVAQAEGRGSLLVGYNAATTPENNVPQEQLFNREVFGGFLDFFDPNGFPGGIFVG